MVEKTPQGLFNLLGRREFTIKEPETKCVDLNPLGLQRSLGTKRKPNY